MMEQGFKKEGGTTGVGGAASNSVEPQEEEGAGDQTIMCHIHPLMMDLVLDNIFSYCSFTELSVARQVNPTWYKTSLPHWLRRGPVIRLVVRAASEPGDEDNAEDEEGCSLPPPTIGAEWSLRNFVHTFSTKLSHWDPNTTYESRGIRKYKRFSIRMEQWPQQHHAVNNELLETFWREWGHGIATLEILHNDKEQQQQLIHEQSFVDLVSSKHTPKLESFKGAFSAVFFGKEILAFDEPKINPHLKSFHLDLQAVRGSGLEERRRQQPQQPSFKWTQLATMYPNLRHLTLHLDECLWPEMDEILNGLLHGARLAKANPKKHGLESLNLHLEEKGSRVGVLLNQNFPSSLVELLREAELPLESLEFRFESIAKAPVQSAADFLGTLHHTLRHLTVGGHLSTNLRWLSSLPNLASLRLLQGNDWEMPLEKENNMILAGLKDELMRGLVLGSLDKFSCDYYHIWSPADIEQLGRWMPNLSQLGLYIVNRNFSCVVQCWPSLQELTVEWADQLDDVGVTGVQVWEGETVDKYPANITHLKELRVFTTSDSNPLYRQRIANMRVPRVTAPSCLQFLQCPSLQKLDIKTATAGEVENLKLFKLLKPIPEVKLTFKNPFDPFNSNTYVRNDRK